MSPTADRTAAVRIAAAIYRVLMIVYPRSFRREYGSHMLQAFRTECRQVLTSSGMRGLGGFWLRALSDLVRSGIAERASTAREQERWPRERFYLGAVVVAVVTGYLHLRADADQLVIMLLLGGTFLCGIASPIGAWRWGVIAGLGIPVALLIGHGSTPILFPHGDGDLPLPAPLIPAMGAAYCGALAHRLRPWHDLALSSDREQPRP